MMRVSQDWMEENVKVKTKKPTLDEIWEGPGLINGGTTHFIRLVFWGDSNGPVTSSTSI